ncbi:aspartyl protease ASP3 [Babesia caballi]|uniref:Aspartyl protease ASP3 n=1 Tax=Babesia caballi TaxID=5871 RepID=A0AAV4M3T9_BABCB|nr:aspartyl protease ASP3 [Babesia caballi]
MGMWKVPVILTTLVACITKAIVATENTENADRGVDNCVRCLRYDESGCKVCLHNGNLAEHSINLKRYNVARSPSAIQMAAGNHELFKKGKVSFAKRNEGAFGSIGYNEGAKKDGVRVIRNIISKNLRMLKRSDYSKYIPIRETKDSLYIGEIKVGTPPQTLHPIFDTGSTNLWIVGSSCTDYSCLKVAHYDPSRSSTFQTMDNPLKIHVKFGTGEIEGYPAMDTVTLGEMVIPDQALAVVESEESGGGENIFDKINFEGIVGLAFPEMSSVPGVPVFDHMALLKNMKHKEFAFYIGKKDEGSKLMFGGVDPRYYEGDIKMFPVVREHYWEVKLDAIFVGDEELCCGKDKSYLIFDSGTSLNTIPSAYFDRFMSYFPKGECDDASEGYPTITYVLNGERITLEPHQYMLKQGRRCIPAYMQLDVPSEFGNAFIVGSNAFMKHYLTVFRRGTGGQTSMVGFSTNLHDPCHRLGSLPHGIVLRRTLLAHAPTVSTLY